MKPWFQTRCCHGCYNLVIFHNFINYFQWNHSGGKYKPWFQTRRHHAWFVFWNYWWSHVSKYVVVMAVTIYLIWISFINVQLKSSMYSESSPNGAATLLIEYNSKSFGFAKTSSFEKVQRKNWSDSVFIFANWKCTFLRHSIIRPSERRTVDWNSKDMPNRRICDWSLLDVDACTRG